MNPKLVALIEDLQRGGDLPFQQFQRRMSALSDELTDERDRVALLATHKAFMDLIERQGGLPPENLEKFRRIRKAEHQLFITKEAMDDGGTVDPAKLHHLVLREVEAGRMAQEDEFAQFAAAGAAVLSPSKPRPSGWLSRLLGR